MKIKLYEMIAKESSAWSVGGGDIDVYIKFELVFSLRVGFMFSVSVMNKVFQHKNPFKALLVALESETVGMCKYDKLKERLRDMDLWSKL